MTCHELTLADLKPGQQAEILKVETDDGSFKRRMASLGLFPGSAITLGRAAPLGDPRIYSVKGYNLGLRNSEARMVSVTLA